MTLFSCVNQRDFIYFQDPSTKVAQFDTFKVARTDSLNVITMVDSIAPRRIHDSFMNYTPVLHPDDLISVYISARDPQAVIPFNGNSGTGSTTVNPTSTYLIDANGNIDFPVIGRIKLAGLNRMEAMDVVKSKLNPFFNENARPIVNIQILNFKITVLGAVRNPGVFPIPHERISLIEAIAMAGDIGFAGLRKNVLVIRDNNGKKSETRVDLTSKDVFSSPVYYLTQNDIVYVEPTREAINTSKPTFQYVSVSIASASFLINIYNLLRKK